MSARDALDGGGGVVAPAQRAGRRQGGILQHGVGGKRLQPALDLRRGPGRGCRGAPRARVAARSSSASSVSARAIAAVSSVVARACRIDGGRAAGAAPAASRLRLAEPFGDGGVEHAGVVGCGLQRDVAWRGPRRAVVRSCFFLALPSVLQIIEYSAYAASRSSLDGLARRRLRHRRGVCRFVNDHHGRGVLSATGDGAAALPFQALQMRSIYSCPRILDRLPLGIGHGGEARISVVLACGWPSRSMSRHADRCCRPAAPSSMPPRARSCS